MRAARCCVWNLPKPVNATSPPLLSVSVIVSRNASTALAGVARRELAPPSHLRHELLLGHVPLLLSFACPGRIDPNRAAIRSTSGFAARSSPARKSGRSRTACRASASAPPSSRSTTQTAVCTTRPDARSASTESSSAPPEVTTSSTRQTHSPSSYGPSSRFAVPYSFASLRTMRNGQPGLERRSGRERDRAELRARRAASRRARARARPPRCARRAAAAARAASRSGTCRGSSATACRSAGGSRLRDRRARRAPPRADRSSLTSGRRRATSCATGSSASASRRPVDERHHRAVVEVDVDALAAPARTSAGRRTLPAKMPVREADEARAAYASSSAFFLRGRFGFGRLGRRRRAGSSSGRRRRARRSAPGPSSPRSAASPSRTTKTLPVRGRGLELRDVAARRAEAAGAREQVAPARASASGGARRPRASSRARRRSRRRARRPRSGTRSRSDRRVPGRHPSPRL